MLEMRCECEACRSPVKADQAPVYICSYECTFCAACAQGHLAFICPNCGGGLVPRPTRIPGRPAQDPSPRTAPDRVPAAIPRWDAGHGLD